MKQMSRMLLFILICNSSVPMLSASEPAETASAIVQAHLAYWDSLKQFTAEYTATYCQSKSFEAAYRKERIDPLETAQITWAMDDPLYSYDEIEDPARTLLRKKPPKLTTVKIPGKGQMLMGEPFSTITRKSVGNDIYSFRYDPGQGFQRRPYAWIDNEGRKPRTRSTILLSSHHDLVSEHIKRFLNESPTVQTVNQEQFEGGTVAKVKFTIANRRHHTLWFMPNRNFALRRVELELVNEKVRQVIDYQYKYFDEQLFPTRVLIVTSQATAELARVTDYELVSFKIGKPHPDLFTISMLPNTLVSGPDMTSPKGQYFITRKQERVTPSEWEKVYQMTLVSANQQPEKRIDTAITPSFRWRWYHWTGIGLAGLGLLVGSRYTWRRLAGAT